MRLAIVDVGLGNLRSVERAVARAARDAGAIVDVTTTREPDAIRRADKVVVPGQGGFGDCSRALAGGLGEALRESIARGAPYLGICLGMQVLFGASEEAPGCAGLGLFAGDVARLPAASPAGEKLKIPHVGWNVALPRGDSRGVLPAEPTHFYFVHSYAVRPADAAVVLATTEYGAPFVSAVGRDNVLAVQFHPEKSQGAGLALLSRFVAA
jgi:glutamine amidotransferase